MEKETNEKELKVDSVDRLVTIISVHVHCTWHDLLPLVPCLWG